MYHIENGTHIQEHVKPPCPEYSKPPIAEVFCCVTSNLLLSRIAKALFYSKTQDMWKFKAQSDKHQKHTLQATAGKIKDLI